MDKLILTSKEEKLRFYIPDDLRIKTYTARMEACTTWKEAEECVLIPMIRNEGIPLEMIARKEFYSRLVPFLKNIGSRSDVTVWNHFTDMAALLKRQKECGEVAMRTLLAGGIELSAPKPGEEARYTVEVVITVSENDREKLLMSALLIGVEYNKVDLKRFDGGYTGIPNACGYRVCASVASVFGLMSYLSSLFGAKTKVDVRYQSRLIHREGLTLEQTIELAKNEME